MDAYVTDIHPTCAAEVAPPLSFSPHREGRRAGSEVNTDDPDAVRILECPAYRSMSGHTIAAFASSDTAPYRVGHTQFQRTHLRNGELVPPVGGKQILQVGDMIVVTASPARTGGDNYTQKVKVEAIAIHHFTAYLTVRYL
jgi:hypothetical protein